MSQKEYHNQFEVRSGCAMYCNSIYIKAVIGICAFTFGVFPADSLIAKVESDGKALNVYAVSAPDPNSYRVEIFSGKKKLFEDSFQEEPYTEAERDAIRNEKIGNSSYVIVETFSGGARCCFGFRAYSFNKPYFIDTLTTLETMMDIQDVNGDGRREIVIYPDYVHFKNNPQLIPPGSIYSIENDNLILQKGKIFAKFYLEQADEYKEYVADALAGKCAENMYDALEMWYRGVVFSGDEAKKNNAAIKIRKAGCITESQRGQLLKMEHSEF